jgi:hypothetical protein
MLRMPEATRVTFVALAFICFVSAGHAQDPPAQPPQAPQKNPMIARLETAIAGKEQEPAEQVFKNIQLFKGRPAISVLRVMEQAFVPNLGVNCSHCHVPGQWESDEKPQKNIAREMWTLRASVQEQVRKITGNNEVPVTCYTCHKGQAKPAFMPGR